MNKPLKVLVVDDDPLIVKLVEEILKTQGYAVLTAFDGLDAMVKVKQEVPNLIVLDIMMPEINGYDVCRHLKFDEAYKHIPILILTSRHQELDPRLGQMMGIEYLPKPIDRQVFMTKVHKMLALK